MTSLNLILNKLDQASDLTTEETITAMQIIMQGDASEDQIEHFLVALSNKGETVEEITGAATVMRDMAATINAPDGALDCCGTGGDGQSTYNISTAVALVSAACGVPVAKHGNRAASSKSGAADVLESLEVNLDINHDQLEEALRTITFCFLMAPHHHQAMKHVVPIRKKLGQRTIFNILGPLANPANTDYQLIGVYDKKWLRPLAEVLHNLGTKRAWLVHGHDGLDEITLTDKTDCVQLDHGKVTAVTLSPDDFGLPLCQPEELTGGTADENADALLSVLNGEHNAYRNIVLANTAAVLVIHGTATSIKEGVEMGANAIDSGKAQEILIRYIAFTKKAST